MERISQYAVSMHNYTGLSVVVRKKVVYPLSYEDVRDYLLLVMRSRGRKVPEYSAKTIIRVHEIREISSPECISRGHDGRAFRAHDHY
jgi:hypothetical protein